MAKGVYLCELKGTGKGVFLNVFSMRKMLRQFVRSVNHSQKRSEAESILMKMGSL